MGTYCATAVREWAGWKSRWQGDCRGTEAHGSWEIAASPEAPRNVHTFSRRATACLATSAYSGYCEPLAWQSHGTGAPELGGTPVAGRLPRRLKLLAMSAYSGYCEPLAWQSHRTGAPELGGTPVAGRLPRRLRLLAMSTPSHASRRPPILDIASPWRGNPTAPEPSELGDCRVA